MSWITTYTGKRIDPINPKLEQISIDDIAHALCHLCRFAGHTPRLYTVGEHSIRVALAMAEDGLPKRTQLAGLLHDATEAYVIDMPRPIKVLPEMSAYREVENRLELVIGRAFGFPLGFMSDEVKKYDTILLATEARDLMGNPQDWPILQGVEPRRTKIGVFHNPYCKQDFLRYFHSLTAEMKLEDRQVVYA